MRMSNMTTNTNKTTAVGGTSSNRSGPPAELYEQFVFTHCRPDESCNGEAGFQMRMRSCADPQMQEFTSKLSYEPLDTQMHLPETSPQRLAWLTCPVDGKKDHYVLAHSRYLGRDTEGRWGNYYTRTIFYPRRKSLKQILQCCDSSLWDDLDFGNKGIETSAKFSGIPERGASVDDLQLYRFLSDEEFPGRIGKTAPEQRQRLLAWTTTACIKALNSESPHHVYIHAEPSLVALLLYGAATVLPEGFMRQLTFSTYEKPGHQLRSFKSATVIGTITDHPEEGLHDDFLERQGFVLDTFRLTCSPEVKSPLFDRLDDYIDLAANAKWDKLKELHSLFSLAETTTTRTLSQAWQVHSDRELLTANAESLPNDEVVSALRRLRNLELGEKLLKEELTDEKNTEAAVVRRRCRDLLWQLIRTQCTHQEELWNEFREVLTQPTAMLQHREQVVNLICGQDESWRDCWRLYRALSERAALADFEKLLSERVMAKLENDGNKTIDLEFRIDILREYQQLKSTEGPLPTRLKWLLRLQNANEIWEFGDLSTDATQFPIVWIGQAMAVSICEQTKAEIVPLLLCQKEKGDTDCDSWWHGFRSDYQEELNGDIRKQKLELIFSSEPDEVVNLFFLLKDHLEFEDADLEEPFLRSLLKEYWEKLEARQLNQYGWMHHWSDINNVEKMLPYLRANEISINIWNTVFETMGLGLLCQDGPQGMNLVTISNWEKKDPSKFPIETRKRLKTIQRQCGILAAAPKVPVLKKLKTSVALLLGANVSVWLLATWGHTLWTYAQNLWKDALSIFG